MENDGLRAITNSLYPVRHSATAMATAASENRAIAYVRVSTSRQADEGYSIADFGGQTVDTSTSTGTFVITMIAALAQMERDRISERTLESMAYLKENHLKFTRAIYGWDAKKDGGIKPNWFEQDKIDYMRWQMDFNDISAANVARSLNKRGRKGKLGGKWQGNGVIRIAYNAYHAERNSFPLPKNWGKRAWHRKRFRVE